MASLRMWALSQVLSVGCGLVGRKAQACLESGWSLQMHCAGSGGGGHVGCQEMQRQPARFLVLEGCVLSAVGLQASSLCCFLLLMRVPSGLLCVSWPGPRKEMMQLVPHLPGCALIQNTKREDVRERFATQGSARWTPTCLPWWQCPGPRAEGSMSSCVGKGSDRIYPLVLPPTPLHSHTPGF